MSQVILRGARFTGRHGVLPHERVTPQPFEVDVLLWADLDRASTSDDLADTIDYGVVFDIARRQFEERRYRLIERLAGAIADEVMAAAPRAERVEVRVRKPDAPLPGDFETVEVRITRHR